MQLTGMNIISRGDWLTAGAGAGVPHGYEIVPCQQQHPSHSHIHHRVFIIRQQLDIVWTSGIVIVVYWHTDTKQGTGVCLYTEPRYTGAVTVIWSNCEDMQLNSTKIFSNVI